MFQDQGMIQVPISLAFILNRRFLFWLWALSQELSYMYGYPCSICRGLTNAVVVSGGLVLIPK